MWKAAGIATRPRTGRTGVRYAAEERDFYLLQAFGPPVGPTEPPIEGGTGAL